MGFPEQALVNGVGASRPGRLTPEGVKTMARRWLLACVGVVVILTWSQAWASIVSDSPYVEIWTDRGDAGTYREGEAIEVYMRAAHDCYVIVYEIDTDGYLRVLYPYECYDDGYVTGGRIYGIGRGGHRRFYVTGPRGVEYIHVVASLKPFRQLYWHGCHGYDDYVRDVTWRGFSDYWGCALPPRIYGDPYIAMQSIDEFICLDALEAELVYADFTYFYVHERVPYPRYVCYDCHGFDMRYRPYVHACTGFTITFVDCDPCFRPWSWWWWCTPRRVYCGPRFVCYCRTSSRHSCKSSCGTSCDTYPSVYKWKSRHETQEGREAVKIRNVPAVDPDRVKTKQKVRDFNLYSVREPKGKTEVPESSRRPDEKVRIIDATARAVTKQKVRDRAVEPPEPPRVEKSREHQAEPPEAARKPSKIEKVSPKVTEKRVTKESLVTRLKRAVKKVTKSDSKATTKKAATNKATKKVAPKVRTKNQGRSPSTRRRVSR